MMEGGALLDHGKRTPIDARERKAAVGASYTWTLGPKKNDSR
jgi:hypothetical protein